MKGDPSFVILKYSTWLSTSEFESKILGAIVREPLKPTNDFIPRSPLSYNDFDFVKPPEPLTDFVLDNTSQNSSHAKGSLTSLANLNFKGDTTESVKLAGKSITYKRLQQHSIFWEKLKEDPTVGCTLPMWVKEAPKDRPPCLVVGIMIAEEVELDFTGASNRTIDGGVELPIAKIAVAAAGAPVAPSVGDVAAGAGKSNSFASVFRAKAGTSSIFALELRPVVQKSSGFWASKRKFVLADDEPEFDDGRLMDDGDKTLPTVKELELGDLSEEHYAVLVG